MNKKQTNKQQNYRPMLLQNKIMTTKQKKKDKNSYYESISMNLDMKIMMIMMMIIIFEKQQNRVKQN